MSTDTARNATLGDLATLLKAQHVRKVDIVAPAQTLIAEGGLLRVLGAAEELTEDGVTTTDGLYRPTAIFDGHIAEKLAIPLAYVRRMRAERPDLYDANVNGLLHGQDAGVGPGGDLSPGYPADERSFLVRAYKGEDGGIGVARALLSDRYGITDNLDVLIATLDGIRQSGVEIEVMACDLTDSRMYVQIAAPAVAALAPDLLRGYRPPAGIGGWTLPQARAAARAEGKDYPEGQEPIVFAGFVVSNSETGDGAFSITPRLIVQACKNGLTIKADAMRAIHVGARLDDGPVRWSEDTQRKNLAVVTAKARDAVATFLDADYVRAAIAKIEKDAGAPVTGAAQTIEKVGKKLNFSQAQIDGVLDHFIAGAQMTAGGVLQAVTSYAQTIGDADAAYDFEAKGLDALSLVASGV